MFKSQMSGANFAFKEKYMRTLEISFLVAAVIHVLAAVTVPPIDIQPYTLEDEIFEAVDVPDDIVIPPPPEEFERPQLPTEMEISDDVSADETIPETDFNPFEPTDITENTGGSGGFYAFDTPPKPIKRVPPEYPELARQAGAEGVVHVEVTIDETGRVIHARVIKSDTIKSLGESAKRAAMDWLFTPAKQRDQPVKARIVIPFQFNLN